jgi:hypothetical protein
MTDDTTTSTCNDHPPMALYTSQCNSKAGMAEHGLPWTYRQGRALREDLPKRKGYIQKPFEKIHIIMQELHGDFTVVSDVREVADLMEVAFEDIVTCRCTDTCPSIFAYTTSAVWDKIQEHSKFSSGISKEDLQSALIPAWRRLLKRRLLNETTKVLRNDGSYAPKTEDFIGIRDRQELGSRQAIYIRRSSKEL